tara:strand:- start:52 stop:867 length:816 start_codon:yes stop_codon:yes gene_type:complete
MLEVISLGAGVQSTVMALMAAKGELTPMPDCAIFADTMFEPEGVYTHLDWLETQLPYPVYRVTGGDLRQETLDGGSKSLGNFQPIPFYTIQDGKPGLGRRECTSHYKIKPVRAKMRQMLGLKKGERSKGVVSHSWIGISTDEAMRIKPTRDAWVENVWPLIDADMSRQDCLRWFESRYPLRALAKSACVACPFHNNSEWRDMKMNDPKSWQEAVDFDKRIRIGRKKDKEESPTQQFVHPSRKPLDEVDFRNLEDFGQLNMFNGECEGMCGV